MRRRGRARIVVRRDRDRRRRCAGVRRRAVDRSTRRAPRRSHIAGRLVADVRPRRPASTSSSPAASSSRPPVADAAARQPSAASRRRTDHLDGGVIVPFVILSCSRSSPSHHERAAHGAPGALQIDVVGKRWWWEVTYPGTGITTANEIHVPLGTPIELHLTSDNVIHSFWVPQLAGKIDTIPGQANHLRFTRRHARHVPGRVRGVLRHPARAHGLRRGRADRRPTSTGGSPSTRAPPLEPASELADDGELAFNARVVRRLPHDRRHRRHRHRRPRPHRRRARARRSAPSTVAQHAGGPRALDPGRPGDEAGHLDARIRPVRRRRAGLVAYLESLRVDDGPLAVDRAADARASTSELDERLGGRARDPRLLHHRRPQARRHPLHRTPRSSSSSSPGCSRWSCARSSPSRTPTSLSAETYNELFTMHGTTMIFLFNTPVLAGFGNYLLPLQIGSPRHGLPATERVQLLDLPLRRASSCTRASSSATRPNGGWFAYMPLTTQGVLARHQPRLLGPRRRLRRHLDDGRRGELHRHDVQDARAGHDAEPHADLRVVDARVLVHDDLRRAGRHGRRRRCSSSTASSARSSSCPAHGGSTLLYQHLFWFWGHPEVYILFLPATGMISMIIPVFSRRALAGYLWIVDRAGRDRVHQLRRVGAPHVRDRAARRWRWRSSPRSAWSSRSRAASSSSRGSRRCGAGKVRLTTPMLFAVGFLLIFLLGGITGVMVAVLPFDWQVTDSYFVVAHFHYVLNGAVVFPIFGALYYWCPKMTGRMLDERLGKMELLDDVRRLQRDVLPDAHPRLPGHAAARVHVRLRPRVGHAQPDRSASASFVFGPARCSRRATSCGASATARRGARNPWDADSLEWATSSPPPEYNFAAIPVVASRHPLWDRSLPSAIEVTADEPSTRALGVDGALEQTMPVTDGLRRASAGQCSASPSRPTCRSWPRSASPCSSSGCSSRPRWSA